MSDGKPSTRRYEIYDKRTGVTIEAGYTKREAENSIAWCWNTGGEIDHLGVRKPMSLVYRWGNNAHRAELKGRECVMVAKGTMGSVLFRFLDTGELVVSSWRAAS